MKKTVTFLCFLGIGLAAIMSLPSCLKDDFNKIAEETTDSETVSYSGFDFSTIEKFDIEIELLNSLNAPVDGALVEIYSDSPLSSEGILRSGYEKDRIFKGVSNSTGLLSFQIAPATYYDSIYAYVKFPGLPAITSAALNQQNISMVIGGTPDNLKSVTTNSSLKNFNSAPWKTNGYYVLGSWHSNGVPYYLESKRDVIDNALLKDISASLPEGIPLTETHPQYLSSADDGNLYVEEPCEIWVTFVHEGASWKNSLGYYTYSGPAPQSTNDIDNKTIIFPNVSFHASGGNLISGDKVRLKYYNPKTGEYSVIFPAGTTVGWFLVAQGWHGNKVGTGLYTHYSDKQLNLSEDDNLKKQNVLLYDKNRKLILIAFEDINRESGGDSDFNDAIFYATANPADALKTDDYEPVDKPFDSDNDGVSDVFDEFPDDADVAFNNYYPSENGFGTLVYEDLWPYKGDYDFNDLVVDYRFNQMTNAQNKIAAISGSVAVRAIGASFSNAFGIMMDMPPANIKGVTGQRFTQNFLDIAENGTENGQNNAVVILFDDAFNVLPHPGEGSGVNTYPQYPKVDPDTLNFSIEMVSPVSFSNLGSPPYNPFIIVDRNRGVEVHLPNHPPTQLADVKLLGTGQDNSDPARNKYYVSDIYLPWAINMPESFDYPVEKQDITKAYLLFNDWATSQGLTFADWYTDKPGYRDNQKIY